jgi:TRAP-type C4-dicarboxylate transport system permease large subunit
MAGVSKMPFERVIKATVPFLLPLLLVLILITIFPWFVTALPDFLMPVGV